MAYIYNADIFCDSCGKAIKKRIKKEGKAPADPRDETSYDSDEYPKWGSNNDEADSPQHCGSHEDCLEAIELPSGRKIGELIGDSLTTDGVQYVRDEHLTNPTEVTELWVKHYGIKLEAEEIEEDDDTDEYVGQ